VIDRKVNILKLFQRILMSSWLLVLLVTQKWRNTKKLKFLR